MAAGSEPLASAGAALWEVSARLLADQGRWVAAEHAYVEAADRGHPDPTRQLARASGCAAARGDSDRSAELLAAARRRPGADAHPAVALREIESMDDPVAMLERLDVVEPSNAREPALVHALRGRAHLRQGDYATASRDADEALAVDENAIAAREVRGMAALGASRDRLLAGQRPETRAVRAALEDLTWMTPRSNSMSSHVRPSSSESRSPENSAHVIATR